MKNTFLIITLLASYFVNGQTIVNLHPVSGFQVASDNLLDFDVIAISTGTAESVNVSFRIRVFDNSKGANAVLEMNSGKHTLAKGVNSFTTSNVNILRKKFMNQELASYEAKMRSFPTGNYSYCVAIVCEDNIEACRDFFVQENNQRQCSEFSILPMSPLLLSFPEDEDVIKEKRPNFNWIPPMPLGSDPDISYELTLVHLNKDQKGEDGIRRNRAIYKRDGIRAINMTYPTTMEDLEAGEHYAWQVQAYLGKIHAATSEVWEFEIEEEAEVSFIELSDNAPSGFVSLSENQDLFVIHKGKHIVELSKCQIANTKTSLVIEKYQPFRPNETIDDKVMSGLNKYRINLSSEDLSPGIYEIIIVDMIGKSFSLRVQITE